MYQQDRDNLNIFEFYKKLPQEEQDNCEIFITPEKIYRIQYGDGQAVIDLKSKLKHLRNLPSEELVDNLENYGSWSYHTLFTRIVDAMKEYLQLRPKTIENYPECLI